MDMLTVRSSVGSYACTYAKLTISQLVKSPLSVINDSHI